MVRQFRRLVGLVSIRTVVSLVSILLLATIVFSVAKEEYTNHLWMSVHESGQGYADGVEFSAHIPANFTNKIEVFACTNLMEQKWYLAITNLATLGTDTVVWSDSEFTNLKNSYLMCVNAEWDTDGDQLPDGREKLLYRTDMTVADTDGDGMPDGWEISFGLDPLQDNAAGDADSDGIENTAEYRAGTSPLSANTAGYLCNAFQDIQYKTLAATRSKCGHLPFIVEDSNSPIVHLYKKMVEEYGGEVHISDSSYERSLHARRYSVTEWDGSTCDNYMTDLRTYAGEYISSSMECSFSKYWSTEAGSSCTNSQAGLNGHECGMAGYSCGGSGDGGQWIYNPCGDIVIQTATEMRTESISSNDQCWYYGTLSSEYTTAELISRVRGDLGYCGGFNSLSWDYDQSGISFNAPSDCYTGPSGISASRNLSPDETSLTLCKMQYRVGLQTEVGVVYRIEWVEWFSPEAGGDPIDTHIVDYIRGNGDMAYSIPHTVEAPAEDGQVYIDSADTEIGVDSLTPNKGTEMDDGDGDPDTRLFVVCAEPGKQVKVTARLYPSWANTYIPDCFTMGGGLDGSNPRERLVDISDGGSFTVYAGIGSSYKQTTIAVRKVDIEQTATNVCIDCGCSITLNLTSDSYSPSGFTWDSVPSGISGNGTSISFCPTNLSAGTYTVQAYPTGMASCDDECEVIVVKVDIETDETNVCADCGCSITLKLTKDSYSPNGYTWSSTPSGISGTGSSITFNPSNLTENAYVVRAKSVDLPTSCYDECVVNILKVKLTPTDDYDSWLPELNNTFRFKAKIYPSGLEGFFKFYLEDVSQHPGYCMNAPNPVPSSGQHSDSWNDMRFQIGQPGVNISGSQDNIAESTIKHNEQEIVIASQDYGGWGKLRCVAEIRLPSGGSIFCDAVVPLTGGNSIKLPKDNDNNDIADAWSFNTGNSVDDLDQLPGVSGNGNTGDGLSRFEEYRGFLLADSTTHRLDPTVPNFFLWNDDQLPVSAFESASHLSVCAIAQNGMAANKKVNFANDSYHVKNQYAVTIVNIDGLNGYYDPNTLLVQIGRQAHQANCTGHELGHAVNCLHHDDYVNPPEDRRYNGPICFMKYYCSTNDGDASSLVFCECATPSAGCVNAETTYPCWLWNSTYDCLNGRCACIRMIGANPIHKYSVVFPD